MPTRNTPPPIRAQASKEVIGGKVEKLVGARAAGPKP
jgi:hypothetical protein